jgi:hypothetical protein
LDKAQTSHGIASSCKARTWGGIYSKFSSWLDFTEIQAAGEKNAAYIYYYTTKPARKPVTYVTDQGNSIGVALGIGLSGCDIDKCHDADTGKILARIR